MSAGTSDELDGRLTRDKLHAVLAGICAEAGLDPTGAELIKFTNNAVFRLATVPVIVRIAGSAAVRRRVGNVIRVAHWLAESGIPAVRLLSGVAQPVMAAGQVATLWHAVPWVGAPPTGADLGSLLRDLHTVQAPPPNLPEWQPLRGIRQRLDDAEGLNADEHAFLVSKCDEIENELAEVSYVLSTGVIHGDATVANLIPGPSGPVFCDFDSTSIGPREWDLTPVAFGRLRFNYTRDNQSPLADRYGFDVTTWDGFPVLWRLRELQLVTSVVPILRSNPGIRTQWRHRLETFKRGDTAAKWETYR